MTARVINSANPLPTDIDWDRVQGILGVEIDDSGPSEGEVVNPSLVCECEADLLGTEREEMNRLGEVPDIRVRMSLQRGGTASRSLAALDSLEGQISATLNIHHSSPSACSGASSVGEAGPPRRESGRPSGAHQQSDRGAGTK